MKKEYCGQCGKLIFDGQVWLEGASLVGDGPNPYICETCFPKDDDDDDNPAQAEGGGE